MKISFEHLGPIEKGEIELAPLTILCGPNNTGKTYITYLIYYLLAKKKSCTKQELTDLFRVKSTFFRDFNFRLTDLLKWKSLFLASTERTGAVIFKTDLNVARYTSGNIARLGVNTANISYPAAIESNVFFVNNSIPDDDMRDVGSFAKAYPEILDFYEREVVRGRYSAKNGNISFVPDADQSVRLGMGIVSSAVRSLCLLTYWLSYYAEKEGNILIIDEPELNIHPSNQRMFARFLVKLVNAGVYVFVTTHSDVIIREFNSLIMLNNNMPHRDEVARKYRYGIEEKLDPQNVILYITKKEGLGVKLEAGEVDPKYGLDVESFDDTFLSIDDMQNDLLFGDS